MFAAERRRTESQRQEASWLGWSPLRDKLAEDRYWRGDLGASDPEVATVLVAGR